MRKWVIGLALGLGLGWLTGTGVKIYTGQPELRPALAQVEASVQPAVAVLGAGGAPSLAPMLKEVMPAVVNLSVRGGAAPPADPGLSDHPALRGPELKRRLEQEEKAAEPEFEAAGSGVIVDARNGYVVTSYHVVEQADEVLVTLGNGSQYHADKVGVDPDTDIALVRIRDGNPGELRSLPWGESNQLQVGDIVVAVGNPFGLEQSVTAGVVSAVGRSGLGIHGYENFIQTDASINPGHSGGALVNIRGELVGINTAILSPGGGNIGIGFALPSSLVRNVAEQLAKDGEVRRGQIGVLAQTLTPELAADLKASSRKGAVIAGIQPGSPAASTDLRPGDVVTALNGNPVTSADQMRYRIGLLAVGAPVELAVEREGQNRTVRLEVGERLQELSVAPVEAMAE